MFIILGILWKRLFVYEKITSENTLPLRINIPFSGIQAIFHITKQIAERRVFRTGIYSDLPKPDRISFTFPI